MSRNVYWLPTQTDELDWANSNWYLTPLTRYADLTALQTLSAATSEVRASLRHDGATDIATVTLTLPASSSGVALFQHVSIKRSAGGASLLPILWSDNDVTLWPGESLTLTASFFSAAGGEASRRSQRMEPTNALRSHRRREPDGRFTGYASLIG